MTILNEAAYNCLKGSADSECAVDVDIVSMQYLYITVKQYEYRFILIIQRV